MLKKYQVSPFLQVWNFVSSLSIVFHPLHFIDIPNISNPVELEKCVSNFNIAWNDTTRCVPVNYAVMLSDSGRLIMSDNTSVTSYNFTGLTSNTSYSVTITASNRVGRHAVMMSFDTPVSNGNPHFINFVHICIMYIYVYTVRNYNK